MTIIDKITDLAMVGILAVGGIIFLQSMGGIKGLQDMLQGISGGMGAVGSAVTSPWSSAFAAGQQLAGTSEVVPQYTPEQMAAITGPPVIMPVGLTPEQVLAFQQQYPVAITTPESQPIPEQPQAIGFTPSPELTGVPISGQPSYTPEQVMWYQQQGYMMIDGSYVQPGQSAVTLEANPSPSAPAPISPEVTQEQLSYAWAQPGSPKHQEGVEAGIIPPGWVGPYV